MNTSHEFHLMQLADSFFPSGMFGMSGGLESFVKHRKIKTDRDVLKFIRYQIYFQLAPCDCIVLSETMATARNNNISKIINIDNRFFSIKLVKEIRNASVRSGQQVLNCVMYMLSPNNKNKFVRKFQNEIESKQAVGTYPVCLGIAAHCLQISRQSAVRMMLYSYSVSVIGAALRLGIIQHLNGQWILMQLAEDINTLSKTITRKTISDIWQLTPFTDILQMAHEHDDSRMFIT